MTEAMALGIFVTLFVFVWRSFDNVARGGRSVPTWGSMGPGGPSTVSYDAFRTNSESGDGPSDAGGGEAHQGE